MCLCVWGDGEGCARRQFVRPIFTNMRGNLRFTQGQSEISSAAAKDEGRAIRGKSAAATDATADVAIGNNSRENLEDLLCLQ